MSTPAEWLEVQPNRLTPFQVRAIAVVGLIGFMLLSCIVGAAKVSDATRMQNSSAAMPGQPARYYLHELGVNVEPVVPVSIVRLSPTGVQIRAELNGESYEMSVPLSRIRLMKGPVSQAYLELDDSPIQLKVLEWTCHAPHWAWYLFPYTTGPVCSVGLTPEASRDPRFVGSSETRTRFLLQDAVLKLHLPQYKLR